MFATSCGATCGRCHQLPRQTNSSGFLMVSKNAHTRRKSVLDITAQHNFYLDMSHQLYLTSMNKSPITHVQIRAGLWVGGSYKMTFTGVTFCRGLYCTDIFWYKHRILPWSCYTWAQRATLSTSFLQIFTMNTHSKFCTS
jgi:hypothetical protein